jgi:hypothetical protein
MPNTTHLKNIVFVFIPLIVLALIVSSTIIKLNNQQTIIEKTIQTLFMKSSTLGVGTNVWPNTYTTVQELEPADMTMFINQVDRKLFVFTLFGMLVMLTKDFRFLIPFGVYYTIISYTVYNPYLFIFSFTLPIIFLIKNSEHPAIVTFFYVYFIGILFSLHLGMRWSLLFIPIEAILVGVFSKFIFDKIPNDFKLFEMIRNGFRRT